MAKNKQKKPLPPDIPMTPEIRKFAWTAGILGLLIPGAGHFYVGQRKRAMLVAGVILFLFVMGIAMHGEAAVPSFDTKSPEFNLVPILIWVAQLGMGILGWIACILQTAGVYAPQPVHPAYEIATLYIMVAGTLNFHVAFNAFDQAVLKSVGKLPEIVDSSEENKKLSNA